MKKSTKKTENKTSQNVSFDLKRESNWVDDMERKITKLTDMATASEIQTDMDLNEAAELLDKIDTELAKGIEARQTIENKVPLNVPIKQSSFFNNRVFLTLGISTIAAVLLVIGNNNNQQTGSASPMIAQEEETADKKLVAPMYGFTEKKELNITITLEEYDKLVAGLPVYQGNGELKTEDKPVRYTDETNAEKIIYQFVRKENSIGELKLSMTQDKKNQLYVVHFTLDGKKVYSKSIIADHLSQWPELKSMFERRK